MKKTLILLLALCAGCAPTPPPSLEGLNGLGVLVLERRDRDPRTSSMVDAVVFFPPAPVRYVRRQNGDHVLLINAREKGLSPQVVGPGDLERYRKVIVENNMTRRTVAQDVIVFCALTPCYVFWNRDARGQVELEVRDRLQPKSPAEDLDRLLPRE